ncbi:hypothetical protein JW905_16575, partial [bacterium]|nr:hypothetical protein [candidate division CSSED10-310 bacterium]
LVHKIGIHEEWIEGWYDCSLMVSDAPLFSTGVRLPAGMDVLAVEPAAAVSDYRVESNADGVRVLVEFTSAVIGSVSFTIKARLPRVEDAAEYVMPLARLAEAQRERGVVVIDSIDRFKLQTLAQEGLLPVSLDLLRREGKITAAFGVIAYRYSRSPIALRIGVQSRSSRLTATVYSHVSIEQDLVRVRNDVQLSVQFAGMDRFKIQLPVSVAESVEIEGRDLKEKAVISRDEQHVVWEVIMQESFTGTRDIQVSYDQKLSGGKGTNDVTTAHPQVLDATREIGYLLISKGENIEISALAENLEPYDPAQVPEAYRGDSVILCWKYVKHPFKLVLTTARHELEDLVTTIAYSMHQTLVLSKERTAVSHLRILLHSKGRQYVAVKLPGSATLYEVMVNGEEVRPSLRPSDEMTLIPLANSFGDERMLAVELLYEFSMGRAMNFLGWFGIDTPSFDGIPLQRVVVELYLPTRFVYFPPGGDMDRLLIYDQLFGKRWESNVPVNERSGMQAKLAELLVKQGRRYEFEKLHSPGTLWFFFMGRHSFLALKLAALLLPLALGIWLPVRLGFDRRLFYTGLAGAAVLLMVVVSAFYRGILWWVFAAALVLAAVHHRIWRRVPRRRATVGSPEETSLYEWEKNLEPVDEESSGEDDQQSTEV